MLRFLKSLFAIIEQLLGMAERDQLKQAGRDEVGAIASREERKALYVAEQIDDRVAVTPLSELQLSHAGSKRPD